MTILNIRKCILHDYTSVKVGAYSSETICTGAYSSRNTFFLAKIWPVPILSKHPVCICIYIYDKVSSGSPGSQG